MIHGKMAQGLKETFFFSLSLAIFKQSGSFILVFFPSLLFSEKLTLDSFALLPAQNQCQELKRNQLSRKHVLLLHTVTNILQHNQAVSWRTRRGNLQRNVMWLPQTRPNPVKISVKLTMQNLTKTKLLAWGMSKQKAFSDFAYFS